MSLSIKNEDDRNNGGSLRGPGGAMEDETTSITK
jgi:hypothetical protein